MGTKKHSIAITAENTRSSCINLLSLTFLLASNNFPIIFLRNNKFLYNIKCYVPDADIYWCIIYILLCNNRFTTTKKITYCCCSMYIINTIIYTAVRSLDGGVTFQLLFKTGHFVRINAICN